MNKLVVLAPVALLIAIPAARADEPADVGTRLVHDAALAEACSNKTMGELGAPPTIVHAYGEGAVKQFATQYGREVGTVVDVRAIRDKVGPEAETLLAQADRDTWPEECDTAFNAIVAASKGDLGLLKQGIGENR